MNWVQSKFTDFAVPPSKRQKLDKDSNKKTLKFENSQSKTLVRSWKPRLKADLVVAKKKIDEVEFWLSTGKSTFKSPILLLTGPPGCGKLTTLKVLCSQLKINLVEWLPQVAQRAYNPESGEFYQSASSLFEEFIVRATRYTNVLNSMSSRVMVIKDIPNCYLKEPVNFHEFLEKYSRIPDIYLVFIITDVPLTRSLFPEHVKTTLNVTTIAFNPVTQRGVKDALKKIFQNKFVDFVDQISITCNGDLRKAITSFEFAAKNGVVPKKKSKEALKPKTDFLDIFHGLGRILYSKREDGKLVHDPVEVGETFTTSPDLFLGMLNENYLYTYSNIHDIAKSSDTLATSELLLNDFRASPFGSTSYSLVVASCGVMIQNSSPIRRFQQLNKPGKVTNILTEFRSRYSDTNVLLDVAAYGRCIPSFSKENGDLLSRITELK